MALLDEGGVQKNSPPTINPFKKYETPGRRNWWNKLIEKNSFRSKFTKQLDETQKMTLPSLWDTLQEQRKKAEAVFKLAEEAKLKQQSLLQKVTRPMPGINEQPADEKDKNPFQPHIPPNRENEFRATVQPIDPFSVLNPNINNIFKVPEAFREEAWTKMIDKTPLPKTTKQYLIGFMGGEQDGSSLTPETKGILDRLKVGDNTAWYDLTRNQKIKDELLKAGTPKTLNSFFDETKNKLLDEVRLNGGNVNEASVFIDQEIQKALEKNKAEIIAKGVDSDKADRVLIYGLTYQATFEDVINDLNAKYPAADPIPVMVPVTSEFGDILRPEMIFNPNLAPSTMDEIDRRMLDQFGEKWISDTFNEPAKSFLERVGKKLLKYVPEGETGYKLATGKGITIGDILRGLPMAAPIMRGYDETLGLVDAVRESGGSPIKFGKAMVAKQIGDTLTSSTIPDSPIKGILEETDFGKKAIEITTPIGALGTVGKLFDAKIIPAQTEPGKIELISYNELHAFEMRDIARPAQEFIKPAYQPFVEPLAEISEHTIDAMFNAYGVDTDLAHSIRNGLIDDIVAEQISPTNIAFASIGAGVGVQAIRQGALIGSKKAVMAGATRLMFELFGTGLEPGLWNKGLRGLNEIAVTGVEAWARKIGPDLKQSKTFQRLANTIIETTQTDAGRAYVISTNQVADKSRAARLMMYNAQRNVIQSSLPEHLAEEVKLVEVDIEAASKLNSTQTQAREILIRDFQFDIKNGRIPKLENIDPTNVLNREVIEQAYNDLYTTFGREFVDNYRLGRASAQDLSKISEFIRNPVRPRASVLKELVADYNNQLDAEIVKLSANRTNVEEYLRTEGFIPEREMYREATGLSPVMARPIESADEIVNLDEAVKYVIEIHGVPVHYSIVELMVKDKFPHIVTTPGKVRNSLKRVADDWDEGAFRPRNQRRPGDFSNLTGKTDDMGNFSARPIGDESNIEGVFGAADFNNIEGYRDLLKNRNLDKLYDDLERIQIQITKIRPPRYLESQINPEQVDEIRQLRAYANETISEIETRGELLVPLPDSNMLPSGVTYLGTPEQIDLGKTQVEVNYKEIHEASEKEIIEELRKIDFNIEDHERVILSRQELLKSSSDEVMDIQKAWVKLGLQKKEIPNGLTYPVKTSPKNLMEDLIRQSNANLMKLESNKETLIKELNSRWRKRNINILGRPVEKLPQGYEDLMSTMDTKNFEDIYTILENEGYSTKKARTLIDAITDTNNEEERVELLRQLSGSDDVEKLRALTTAYLKPRNNGAKSISLYLKDDSAVMFSAIPPTKDPPIIFTVDIEDIIAAPGMGNQLDNNEYLVLVRGETVPNISPKEAARWGKYYTNPGVSTVLRGMAGFSLGYASGDTPEERLRNALLGSALGVFGPVAVRGGRLATELATHRASFMKQLDFIAYDTKMAGVLPNELIFSPTKIIKWQGDDIKVNFFRAGDNVEIAGAEAVVHRADHIMSINIDEYDNISEDYIGLVLGHELAHVYETFIVRTFIEKDLIKRGTTYDESLKNLAQYFAVERNIQLPPVEIPGKDISEYDLFGELIRQDVAANRVVDTRMAAEHIGDVVGAVLSGDTKDIPEDIITLITKNLQKKPGKDIVRRQFQARGGIISQEDFDRKYKYLIEESGFEYRRPTVTKTLTVLEEFSSRSIGEFVPENYTKADVTDAVKTWHQGEIISDIQAWSEGYIQHGDVFEELDSPFKKSRKVTRTILSMIGKNGTQQPTLFRGMFWDIRGPAINDPFKKSFDDFTNDFKIGKDVVLPLTSFTPNEFEALNYLRLESIEKVKNRAILKLEDSFGLDMSEEFKKIGFGKSGTKEIVVAGNFTVVDIVETSNGKLITLRPKLIEETSIRGLGGFSARSSGKPKSQNINEEDMVSIKDVGDQKTLNEAGEKLLRDLNRGNFDLSYIPKFMEEIALENGIEVTQEMQKSPTRFSDLVSKLESTKTAREFGSHDGIVEKITGDKIVLKLDNGDKFETTVDNVVKMPQVTVNLKTEQKIINTFGSSFVFSENSGASTVMLSDGSFAVIDDLEELGKIIDKTNVTEQDITKLINSTGLTKITKLNDGVEISMSKILDAQQRQSIINLTVDNNVVMRFTDAKTGLEIDGPYRFSENKVDRVSNVGEALRAVAIKPYEQWGGTRKGLPHILDTEEYSAREQKIEKLLLAISDEENPSNIKLLKTELNNLEQERILVETYVLAMTRNGELGTTKKIAIARQNLREQLRATRDQNKVKALKREINALEEAARTSEKSIPRTAEEVQQDIAYSRGVTEFITGTTPRYIPPKKGDVDKIGEALDRYAGVPYKPESLSFNFAFPQLDYADNAIANAKQVLLWQRERRNYIKDLVRRGEISSNKLAEAEKGLVEATEALQNAHRAKTEAEVFLLRQNFTNNMLNNMPEGADPVRTKYVTNILKKAYDNLLSILTVDKNITEGTATATRKFALMVEENVTGNLYGPISQIAEMSRMLFDTLRSNTHSIIDPISKRVAKEIEDGFKTGVLVLNDKGKKAIEKLTPEQKSLFLLNEAKHVVQHPEHYDGLSRDLLGALKELQDYQLEHLNIARGLNYPIEAMEAPYLEQMWDVPVHFLAPTGAPRIPGRVSIAHDRLFGDYLEGIKAGYTPKDYSVDAVIRHSAALVDKAISDSFERSVVLEKLGGRKLLPGERGVVGRGFKEFTSPLYSGWVAPELYVKQLDALHVVSKQGNVARTTSHFINRFKNTMFGPGDFGVVGVQVLKALAYGGPTMFAGMINNALGAFDSPWFVKLYMEDEDIMARSVAAALDGVHQGIGPSSITVGEGTLLQYIPIIGTKIDAPVSWWVDKWAKVQFGWTLTPIRNRLYESNLLALKLGGADITNPLVRRTAANNANALTGASRGATKIGRRQLEGTLFISSQMFRSEAATFAQVVKLAWPLGVSGVSRAERIVGLTTLASFALMVYGLGSAIAKFTGNEHPGFDPRKGNWASVTFKQLKDNKGNPLTIPLVPSRGLIRAMGKSIVALGGTDEMFNAMYEGDMDSVLAEIRAMSPDELSQIWLQYIGSKGNPAIMAVPNLSAGIGYYDGAFRMGGVPLEGRIRNSAPLPLILKQAEIPFGGFGNKVDRYLSEEEFSLLSPPAAFGALGINLYPLSASKQRDESVTNWAIENNIRNAEGQLVTKHKDLDKFQQTTYGETDIGSEANRKVDEARDKQNDKFNQLNTAWEKEKIIKTAMIALEALEIQPNVPGGAQRYKDAVRDINSSFSRTYENLAKGFDVDLTEHREPRSRDEELWYELIALDPGAQEFFKPSSFTKTGDIIPAGVDFDKFNAAKKLITDQMTDEAQKQVREGKFNSLDDRANEAAKRKDVAGRQLEKMLNIPKYKGLTKEEGDQVDELIESVDELRDVGKMMGISLSRKDILMKMYEIGMGDRKIVGTATVLSYDLFKDSMINNEDQTIFLTNPDIAVYWDFTYNMMPMDIQQEWFARYGMRTRREFFRGLDLTVPTIPER